MTDTTIGILTCDDLTQVGIDDRWDFLYHVYDTKHAINFLNDERNKYYEDDEHVGTYSLQFILGCIYDLHSDGKLAEKHYRLAITENKDDDHARVNLYLLLDKKGGNYAREGLVFLKYAAEREFARAIHHLIKRQLIIDIIANNIVDTISITKNLNSYTGILLCCS